MPKLIIEDSEFDFSDDDYQMWLEKEYQYWKAEEDSGFSSAGEYADWIYRGDELGFLTETTDENTENYE